MACLSMNIHKSLCDKTLKRLQKRNIFTLLEFYETDAEDLVKLSGLKYRQVLEVKEAILSSESSKVIDANSYFKQITAKQNVSSGIPKLDELLDGGFECGLMYELCGPSPSGKSQICMTSAASVCAGGEFVFYIDTKGDISAPRLSSNLKGKATSEVEALGKLQICEPNDPYQLISVLHKLANEIIREPLRLLIIDSLAAVFIPLAGDHNESVSLLSTVSSFLQFIANEYCIPIIVTNLTTKWHGADSDEIQKASLGRYWEHIPSTRIAMSQLAGNDILLTVTKSNMLPIGSSCTLKISEEGVT